MIRRLLIAAALVLVAATGAFAWLMLAPRATAPGQPPLVHLDDGSFHELARRFNAAPDTTRLLLMLSPT